MALNKRKHTSFLKNKHVYKSPGPAKKAATRLGLKGIHAHGRGKTKRYMPGSSHKAYTNALRKKRRK
jgi:hypothetical protein